VPPIRDDAECGHGSLATWINPDNSQDQPFFAYDPEQDALFLTGDFAELSNLNNSPTVFLVVWIYSFHCFVFMNSPSRLQDLYLTP
jgi:hypothetical protein